jgi:hypothetical protein
MSIYLLFIAFVSVIGGCKDSTSTTSTFPSTRTDTVYVVVDTPLVYSYGNYVFFTGVINVSKYSQIRVNTSERGTGVINVSLIMTDKDTTDYAVLDYYALDSNISNGSSTTRVYEVPGTYIRMAFISTDSLRLNVNIFGR